MLISCAVTGCFKEKGIKNLEGNYQGKAIHNSYENGRIISMEKEEKVTVKISVRNKITIKELTEEKGDFNQEDMTFSISDGGSGFGYSGKFLNETLYISWGNGRSPGSAYYTLVKE